MATSTVLVTGYTAFGQHNINASWEAVKLLPSMPIENVNLVIKDVPVVYEDVDNIVPQLWKDLKPKLVVHVGVHSFAGKCTLEVRGHSSGYVKKDNLDKIPNVCSASNDECLITKLDYDKICQDVNNVKSDSLCTSDDAGRYLCEYIYYKSLKIDQNRVLFVHVPTMDVVPSTEVAAILREIILSALKCLDTQDKICSS